MTRRPIIQPDLVPLLTESIARERRKKMHIVDWRTAPTLTVRESFPGLDQGGIRLALVRAIARAATPGDAAAAVSEAAKKLALSPAQRLAIAAMVASLTSEHMRREP